MKKLALALLVVIPLYASGTVYVPQEIPVYFDNAETVARIYVKEGKVLQGVHDGERVQCGQRIKADVIESFKGEDSEVTFDTQGISLELGKEYLVFIEKAGAKAVTPILSTNSVSAKAAYVRQKACADFKPEFTVSWLTTAEFLPRWNPDKGEMEDWITPAFNIAIPEDSGVKFQSVRLHAMKVDGDIVESDSWSSEYDVVFPWDFWVYMGAYEWSSYRDYLLAVTGAE